MSLNTPTTAELRDNIVSQLEASLAQTIPLLPKAFMRVLASVLAGVFIVIYKYGGWIFMQLFVSTAQMATSTVNGKGMSPLKEWGRLVGVGDPSAATTAELIVDVAVTNQAGSLPAFTQMINTSTGVVYLTVVEVLLNAASVPVNIRAASDSTNTGGIGVQGNMAVGEEVAFVSPVAGVDSPAFVASQVTTAADAETDEHYRQRILDRFQKQPQGGAYADYEQWGEEAAGVENIYPYTGEAGEVNVYVESSTEPDGIPTPAQLAGVAALIELDENGLATRRPAGAFVNTLPITRPSYEVIITDLIVDDEAQVKSDIEQGLIDYFLSRDPYIVGVSVPPRVDRIAHSSVAAVVDSITTAAGGVFASVALTKGGVPMSVYVLGEGEKAKLDYVVFI